LATITNPFLKSYGTSFPPFGGWQRHNRLTALPSPVSSPCFSIAIKAKFEQEGSNLHELRSRIGASD